MVTWSRGRYTYSDCVRFALDCYRSRDMTSDVIVSRCGAGDSVFITPFNVSNLLPQSAIGSFFRYSGSLTTPGCSEVVVWTLFTQPIYATTAQV